MIHNIMITSDGSIERMTVIRFAHIIAKELNCLTLEETQVKLNSLLESYYKELEILRIQIKKLQDKG